MKEFLQDSENRKWLRQLLTIVLVVAAIVWCVWLYYSYYVKQLEHQETTVRAIHTPSLYFGVVLRKSMAPAGRKIRHLSSRTSERHFSDLFVVPLYKRLRSKKLTS